LSEVGIKIAVFAHGRVFTSAEESILQPKYGRKEIEHGMKTVVHRPKGRRET